MVEVTAMDVIENAETVLEKAQKSIWGDLAQVTEARKTITDAWTSVCVSLLSGSCRLLIFVRFPAVKSLHARS